VVSKGSARRRFRRGGSPTWKRYPPCARRRLQIVSARCFELPVYRTHEACARSDGGESLEDGKGLELERKPRQGRARTAGNTRLAPALPTVAPENPAGDALKVENGCSGTGRAVLKGRQAGSPT
jgi:hypothetical protein